MKAIGKSSSDRVEVACSFFGHQRGHERDPDQATPKPAASRMMAIAPGRPVATLAPRSTPMTRMTADIMATSSASGTSSPARMA